jgi:hypothetical protein
MRSSLARLVGALGPDLVATTCTYAAGPVETPFSIDR